MSQPTTGAPVLREEWLTLAAEYIRREVRTAYGHNIPQVRLSVGFPLGLRGPKGPTQTGQPAKSTPSQCFEPAQTEDGVAQIFINPTEDKSERVLIHLTHELAHVFSMDAGHVKGGLYDTIRRQWGLVGRGTAPVQNKWLDGVFSGVLVAIGPYEDVHAKVTLAPNQKKQATFMKKVFCRCCGDLERRTQTHIDKLKEAIALGAPSCRKCFVGHPDCTGLCKQPPPPQQGGGTAQPPPKGDFDATPQPPPPPTAPGQSQGDAEGDGQGEGQGEGDEEGDGDGDGDGDGQDEGEDGGGGAQDQGTGGTGAGTGSGTATQAPPATVQIAKASGKWNAKVHRKDLCPFGSGCPQCEDDY